MEDSRIIKTEYSEVMQKSYIDYAMSVIIARALPDVRDGLKPVQRRTLYDMHELGIRYDRPYRKSARIVGDTMGKYHPHGDSSIYEALVVMTQEFKKGMPLIDGHGNFGNIEGDGAAAMRYTEARLEKVTQEAFLSDLDKDVVDFIPNFDETEKEPAVLPVKVPNLLVNGSEGIAVGMATSIPPHNLAEVIDAAKAYMKDPEITTKELMKYVKGPDFPTGGIVINKDDLLSIYETGMGKIKIRGKVEIEKAKGGKTNLVITEIPYPMIGANIGKFLSDVAGLAETKKTQDIVDISNQSSKEGIRIVIELKKDADVKNFINMLYKKTRLEDTFGVNMLAISGGRPETMGLKQVIKANVDFQFEVAGRKYKTLLEKELQEQGADPYLCFQLGQSYRRLHDYEKAAQYFDSGLAMDVDPALDYVQTMVESYGYTLLDLKRNQDALNLLGVYEEFSGRADFVFLMGLIYMNNGLFDQAVAEFQKATTMEEFAVEGVNSYKADYNIGVIYECAGFPEEARKAYRRCGGYAAAKARLELL